MHRECRCKPRSGRLADAAACTARKEDKLVTTSIEETDGRAPGRKLLEEGATALETGLHDHEGLVVPRIVGTGGPTTGIDVRDHVEILGPGRDPNVLSPRLLFDIRGAGLLLCHPD